MGRSNSGLISFRVLARSTPRRRHFKISSRWASRIRSLLRLPFGRPSLTPLARAAAKPCLTRSEMKVRSAWRFRSKRTISYVKDRPEILISTDYRYLFGSVLLIMCKCHVKNRLKLLLITGNVHCNRLLTPFIESKCWKSVISRRKMSLLP